MKHAEGDFIFFLLRKPVTVGGSDKDIDSGRRLKWPPNLISQGCNDKTDAMRELGLPSPVPFADQALLG